MRRATLAKSSATGGCSENTDRMFGSKFTLFCVVGSRQLYSLKIHRTLTTVDSKELWSFLFAKAKGSSLGLRGSITCDARPKLSMFGDGDPSWQGDKSDSFPLDWNHLVFDSQQKKHGPKSHFIADLIPYPKPSKIGGDVWLASQPIANSQYSLPAKKQDQKR